MRSCVYSDVCLSVRMDKQAEVSPGGYDYQFVETPPDMFMCKICHFPSKEPYLSECCGHTFCKSCIDHAKKATIFYFCLCPVCRNEEFKTVRNKQNERVIKSLQVYCTNKAKGCEWQGEINNINYHLESSDGCPYEEVACPTNCDTKLLQRKYLNNHLENQCPCRKVQCQYCHITDELQYIESSHMEKCPKFPLPCPNDCGISDIPRENMDDHKEVCPLEKVDCPNQCEMSFQRQFLQSHTENECPCREVTCQYCQTVGEHQFIEGKHAKFCLKFPLICPNKCEAENILREDMETHKKECPLEVVQCGYHNVGCKAMMVRKDLQQHNKEKIEEHLSYTMSELVNTKDKLASTEEELATSTDKVSKLQEKLKQIEFQSQKELEMRLQKIMDCVHWGFHLNAKTSDDCDQILPVVIKISGFERKRRNNDDWFSHTFFTHEKGYKIKLNVVPAGWDSCKGTHVSVYLYIEEGPHDFLLKWPMKKMFEVKLLNQLSNSQHHSEACNVSVKRGATKGTTSIWNAPRFIPFYLFQSPPVDCKFLDNDTVFFEVSEI